MSNDNIVDDNGDAGVGVIHRGVDIPLDGLLLQKRGDDNGDGNGESDESCERQVFNSRAIPKSHILM